MQPAVPHRSVLIALGGFALLGLPAAAQETQEAPSGTVAGDVPSAATSQAQAEAADSSAIEDIVVTARRRTESLQDTPVAVTAITADTLEARASVNVSDLQGAAPNLLITNQNSGGAAANLSIRGLAFADVEKSFEPTVAVVVDGVFIGTSTGQFLDTFDIDTIEVLRGPQGTLFGRNTIGGVINVRRTRPTGEFGGRLQLEYGRFDTLTGRAVVNLPEVGDLLATKLFYFHSESDGYYRQFDTGERRGFYNNENFGAAFKLTPSDSFDALLTLEKQVQDFDTVNANITKTGEVFCDFIPADQCNRGTGKDLYTVFTQPAQGEFSTPAATLEMNLDLGSVTLTSVSGYREYDEDQTQDFDASSSDLYFTRRVQDSRQYSQEVRAAGKLIDTLDYVVGVYLYDYEYSLRQTTRLFGNVLPDQIVGGGSDSQAVFGDFDLQVTDQIRLSFGGRYTWDQKDIDNAFVGVPLGTASRNFSKFTPKIGADYRPNEDLMFYASWSRGYRSGGFSSRAQTAFSTVTPYGNETVDSYEIGAKSAFFDRRLQINVAAFYADYRDLQQNTTIPAPPPAPGNETIVTNVGSATKKGIELDITVRPVPALTFTGSMGYLKSKFKDFITRGTDPVTGLGAIFDYSAVNSIYSPKVTASLNANYTMPTSFGEGNLNVGYRHISRYDQQISLGPFTRTVVDGVPTITVLSNDPRVRSDAQNLLDASASLSFDLGGNRARIGVYGRNLLDDRGPNAAFTVAGLWSFASAREPRAYGIQLGFEF